MISPTVTSDLPKISDLVISLFCLNAFNDLSLKKKVQISWCAMIELYFSPSYYPAFSLPFPNTLCWALWRYSKANLWNAENTISPTWNAMLHHYILLFSCPNLPFFHRTFVGPGNRSEAALRAVMKRSIVLASWSSLIIITFFMKYRLQGWIERPPIPKHREWMIAIYC